MQAGDSSTSKLLPSQKFLTDRRSLFFLVEKYSSALRLSTDSTQVLSSCALKNASLFFEMQAGVEPANGGFANRSVRPLRHCIILYSNILTTISYFCILTLRFNRRAISYISLRSWTFSPLHHSFLKSHFKKFFHSNIFSQETLE